MFCLAHNAVRELRKTQMLAGLPKPQGLAVAMLATDLVDLHFVHSP